MKKKALNVLKTIGAIIMAVMVIIATLSVVWRTLSMRIEGMDGSSMFWANELQQLLFHWVIVIGMILGYENRSQLNITVFYSMFKGVPKIWLDRIFHLLTIFVFAVVAIWGAKLTITEIPTLTPALELSRGLFVYSPYVLLSLYIVIQQCCELVRSFAPQHDKGV